MFIPSRVTMTFFLRPLKYRLPSASSALHQRDSQHEIDYYNCGAWIDARPTYITVGERGVEIHEFVEHEDVERSDDLHPAGEQSPSDAEFGDEAGLFEDGEYEGVAT